MTDREIERYDAHEHRLKIRKLTYVCKDNPEKLNCYALTTHVDDLAISFNTLRNISSSHIVDDVNMETEMKQFIASYLDAHVKPILDTLAVGKINSHVLDDIDNTIKETGVVLDNISKIMNTF